MKGFGLLETILALGIFSILITVGITGFIPALNSGRAAQEQTRAAYLASEGLEAVRSLRDRNWSGLSVGTYGIGPSLGGWSLTGNADTTDKFTRQIIIAPASRDAGGSLVASGGTVDPDVYNVTSQVNWDYITGDSRTVTLQSFFTNWRQKIRLHYRGLLAYGDGTPVPKWRSYTASSNTFSSALPLPTSGNPLNLVLRTSPKDTQALLGTVDPGGTLRIYCFDGHAWTTEWSAVVGGSGATRRFDLAYETSSGDALVVYSNNTAGTNEISFRTLPSLNGCGTTNWSAPAVFNPLRTTGTVLWVKLASDPRSSSNLITAAWADSAADLSAAVWSGTAFGNEPATVSEASLEVVSAAADIDSFDLEYESLSGNLLMIWGNSAGANNQNGVRYRTCTGGTAVCTWTAVTTPSGFSDDATSLDLAANPATNEMIFASIGNAGNDLQIGYWSGSAWTGLANVDTTSQAPLAGTKLVAVSWLISGSTHRSVVVYHDSGARNISWYALNQGSLIRQNDHKASPAFNSPEMWYSLDTDPVFPDSAMLLVADNSSLLYAKRLQMDPAADFTWTDADAQAPLAAPLSQPISYPYGFAYWRL